MAPQTQLLLDNVTDSPAMVLGRHMSVLAWNSLAAALYTDFSALPPAERNLLRLTFLDPHIRSLYTDWEASARQCVAFVRMEAPHSSQATGAPGTHRRTLPAGRGLRRWWASHDVAHKTFGTKRYRHPVAGNLTLDWQILTCPHDPDQAVMIMTAPPGTPSHQALRLLASWAATPAEPDSRLQEAEAEIVAESE